MVYFSRAMLEFPFSVAQCVIYEMDRVDDFLRIVPPSEKLVGWEEYLPCILRWIILEGRDRTEGQTIGRRDGQENI